MEVFKKAFSEFMKFPDTQFVIPIYQRNYAWEKSHCAQLFEDVLSAAEADDHFVGSIVDVIERTDSTQRLVIIDGQQRVTTVSLIYLAVANALLDQNERQKILKQFLINEYNAEEERLKLRPTANNGDAYRHLINKGDSEYSDYSRVVENYRFFAARVNAGNVKQVQKGLDKLKIVEIRLEPRLDDAQKIFESMNSTGLDLSDADLIRNYILMNLPEKEQNRVFESYWRRIEESARFRALNKDRVSDFVRHYLTLKHRELPAMRQVYRIFKKKHANNYSGEKISPEMEATLAEMSKFSGYFQKILNPEDESHPEIRRHLENLRRLEVGVCHPFLLEVYRDYADNKIDSNIFINVLELIQSYVWRRFIVGLSTQGMNKTFISLYRDIEDVEAKGYLAAAESAFTKRRGAQRLPSNDEVFAGLNTSDVYNIRANNRNYFLERLENDGNNEPIDIENSDITVEHIFPQNCSQWHLSADEEAAMKKRIHTIANLALSGNNSALGNKSFLEKRDMNQGGKKQGYRFSKCLLTRQLAGYDKWEIAEMDLRLESIKRRFVEIWRYPDTPTASDSEEEIGISEMDDNDERKIVAYTFFGERREVGQVVAMYEDIVKKLFDMDPQAFIAGELGEIVTLRKSISELPVSTQKPSLYRSLPGGYYFSAHSSTSQKIKNLRKLLEALELTDELQLTLANN